jgi:hypothetical protein
MPKRDLCSKGLDECRNSNVRTVEKLQFLNSVSPRNINPSVLLQDIVSQSSLQSDFGRKLSE